jgi:hypothetical protein
MAVKQREPKDRRPQISDEALQLFVELEAAPERRRERQDWKDKSKALARMLDLTPEWWMCQHVHDRSRSPCHPPELSAHDAWHKVRAVRQALLAAAKEGEEARECPLSPRKPT